MPKLPIGISDFRKLRRGDYYYADKTLFIREIIDASAEVLLIPRPRRFGKTLNLSMLKYFLEKTEEDCNALFQDSAISGKQEYKVHQGRYPVICLTFKDIKDMANRCMTALL
ncbi:MAG: AAA family ATPase [Desulfobacteraceae bacterium]|nr:AAA family ATPase [Desulfobacteraceae bacterium]